MRDEQSPPDSEDSIETGSQPAGAQPHEIPPEGSLGLLALGAVGITEWRYARDRARKQSEASEASEASDAADAPSDEKPASDDG